MKVEKRIDFIDIARGFAIIFIVLGHTIVHSANCHYVFRFLYSFHVVLFFVLSGYTFSTKDKFSKFLKNKFLRIMVPYFIWALLYLIPYFILGAKVGDSIGTSSSFDVITQLKNVFYGNGNMSALKQNSSLWFLPALFTTQIIYYLLIETIRRYNKIIKCLAIIPIILIAFIFNYYVDIILPWGINTVFVIGIFFYTGYLLRDFNLINSDKMMKLKYMIPMAIIGFITFHFNKTVFCIDYDYGYLSLAMLSGMCFSLITIYISYKIGNFKAIEFIGRNTMAILIFHKLLILIFQTKLGVVSSILKNSNFFLEFFLGLIISYISIAFSLICSAILKKIFPILIGEKKDKNDLTVI